MFSFSPSILRSLRFNDWGRWSVTERKRLHFGRPISAKAANCDAESKLEMMKIAREKFTKEISFRSKDKDVSLAKVLRKENVRKGSSMIPSYCGIWCGSTNNFSGDIYSALLLVAAEDEAFLDFNRDMDARSILSERKDTSLPFESKFEVNNIDEISLAGKTISGWLNELEIIAKEVEAELATRDIGCHLVEFLEAVNVVLFELRGFKRFPVLVDSKLSYFHTVLSSGCGSAIMLSIIYIEICRRLGVSIVGSRVGEDFLIWPQTENLEELFKASSGHSWLAKVNGQCVEDPRSKASDLNSKSILGLDIATNRDILGIALANLIRLHWKRASKSNHGLMLTSPLRPMHNEGSNTPLLRPQELRLAIMASERLLILQPHNWSLRRDHGMLLYYSKMYAEAVQELSICMAFAPVEESDILEPFVEKLHLLRVESSWKSLESLAH